MVLMALLVVLAAPPDLQAVGVVLAPQAERSVAILRSGGRSRVAAVGEQAFGGRVVQVLPDSVVLDFSGTRTAIALSSGAPLAAVATAPARPEAPQPAKASSLARGELERRLGSEMGRILSETAVVPFYDNGQVRGITLARVAQGSLLTDAGLLPGDVITEINGVAIDSMATLLSLYPRLQSESEIRAVVLRSGGPVSLSLSLK